MNSVEWLKPEEYNEAPGECIVGAYWVPNKDCEPNRIMVTCPFDSSHKMKQSKLAGHIVNCEKNFPNHNKVPCIYSALEFIDKDKLQDHLQICPHRNNFMPANPNKIPTVNHKLVESHLTTWEDHDKVNSVLPESVDPEENEMDDLNTKLTVNLDLRKSIAMENQTMDVLEQDSTTDSDDGESEFEEDSICDAWSNSSVVGDFPFLESFNVYRDTYGDGADGQLVLQQLQEQNRAANTNQWLAKSFDHNGVDFSKTCDPVENIGLYRLNHAEELSKGSRGLKTMCGLNISDNNNQSEENDSRNGARFQCADLNDHEVALIESCNNEERIDQKGDDGISSNEEESTQLPSTGFVSDSGTFTSSPCVLKEFDQTHSAPAAKLQRPVTLADLVVFPDEPEHFPYYPSHYDGLHTSYKVDDDDDDDASQVSWRGDNIISSDGDTLNLGRGQLIQSLTQGRVDFLDSISSDGNTGRRRNEKLGPPKGDVSPKTTGRGSFVCPSRDAPQSNYCSRSGRGEGRSQISSHNIPSQLRIQNSSASTRGSHHRPGMRYNPKEGYHESLGSQRGVRLSDIPPPNSRQDFTSTYLTPDNPSPQSISGSSMMGIIDRGENFRNVKSSNHSVNINAENSSFSSGYAGRGQHNNEKTVNFPSRGKENKIVQFEKYNQETLRRPGISSFKNMNQQPERSELKGRGQLMKALIQTKQFSREPDIRGTPSPQGVTGQAVPPQRILGRGAMLKYILERNNASDAL